MESPAFSLSCNRSYVPQLHSVSYCSPVRPEEVRSSYGCHFLYHVGILWKTQKHLEKCEKQ